MDELRTGFVCCWLMPSALDVDAIEVVKLELMIMLSEIRSHCQFLLTFIKFALLFMLIAFDLKKYFSF